MKKKPDFAEEAASVAADLRLGLQIENIEKVRIINRYFAQEITAQDFEDAKNTIFSEPPVDIVYEKLPSFEEDADVVNRMRGFDLNRDTIEIKSGGSRSI